MEDKGIYEVGGHVRDTLLGIPSSDIDYVAVGYRTQDFDLPMVGKDFPVFLDKDGNEIALARTERTTGNGYNDFKCEINGITLEQDLGRRDLTINSMAIRDGKYIDPFNGQKDIEAKVLRHTSEAFIEDPVRVLRLARLRCKLPGFWKVHASTKVLIYSMREQLRALQSDRVWKEVEKALKTERSWIFFETLFELGVLDVIFPSIYQMTTLKEGSQWHQEATVFDHTMMMLKEVPTASLLAKISIVYHDIAKPITYRLHGSSAGHDNIEIVQNLLDMKIPKSLKRRMLILIKSHIRIGRLDEMRPSKKLLTFSPFMIERDLLVECATLYHADINGRIAIGERTTRDPNFEKIGRIIDRVKAYSPVEWLESLDEKPSGIAISSRVVSERIKIIKEEWK